MLEATRDGLGKGLIELAKREPRVVVLSADLTKSLRLTEFEKLFPDRFIQVGIAEQHMISMAAGLAMAGKIPFACSYAAFSPGRTWDQIRVSVCYSKLPVKIIGGHTGLSVGENGAVHQAMEDIALASVLPEMTVISPGDALETAEAVIAAAELSGPVYIRVSKQPSAALPTNRPSFKLGQVYQLKSGDAVALMTHGTMISTTIAAAQALQEQGIHASVTVVPTLKPLDAQAIIHVARHARLLVTIEEHQITGGLGSLIAPILLEANRKHLPQLPQLQRIGMQDAFGESGTPNSLLEKYQLIPQVITQQIITRLWEMEYS